jgi:hypothetical protein
LSVLPPTGTIANGGTESVLHEAFGIDGTVDLLRWPVASS